MELKPEFVREARRTFDQIASRMKLKKKDITFIGVHNRRTDHLAYAKEQFGHTPLTASYFHDAMDIYRQYEPCQKRGHQ